MRPTWPRMVSGWGKLGDGDFSLSYCYGTWRRENIVSALRSRRLGRVLRKTQAAR